MAPATCVTTVNHASPRTTKTNTGIPTGNVSKSIAGRGGSSLQVQACQKRAAANTH